MSTPLQHGIWDVCPGPARLSLFHQGADQLSQAVTETDGPPLSSNGFHVKSPGPCTGQEAFISAASEKWPSQVLLVNRMILGWRDLSLGTCGSSRGPESGLGLWNERGQIRAPWKPLPWRQWARSVNRSPCKGLVLLGLAELQQFPLTWGSNWERIYGRWATMVDRTVDTGQINILHNVCVFFTN